MFSRQMLSKSQTKESMFNKFYLQKLKMIIDSHCHLEYEPMSLTLNKVIARANNDGVKYLLTISTTDNSLKKILKIGEGKQLLSTLATLTGARNMNDLLRAATKHLKIENFLLLSDLRAKILNEFEDN